jgi:hypothetical protein
MKKYLLLITIGIMCCASAMAQTTWTPVKTTQMNPFAYNLSATLSNDQSVLTIKYCLNADVTSLNIVIKKGGQEYTYPVTESSKRKKTGATDPSKPYDPYLNSNTASYVVDIPTSELASTLGTGTFEWRIEVKGAGRANCGVYSLDGTNVYKHKFYRPSSVDIVQDPTSFNYGKVLVVESQHTASTTEGLHSTKTTKTKGTAAGNIDPQGAGIYVFNPDLTPRENTSGTYVFNGKSDSRFANTSYSPHRVRVSEDGRMFVTSMDHTKGAILWEIDNYFSTWTTVIGKGVGGATYSTSTYDLKTSGGSFIAGPNAGFDVKGSGSELTLLMLSCDYTAITANNQTGFECREYKLGTATTWSSAAGKNFNTNSRIFVGHRLSNVQYDENGGIWCVSYREACKDGEPGLVHKTSAAVEDCRILRSGTKNAGFRFNKDFTRVMMAYTGGKGTLYDYDPNHIENASGTKGYFINERNIDMSAVGAFLNDFAWDNANNIFAVGQNDGVAGGNGHLVVYCLPYNANDVFTTPGPSDFTINCKEGLTYTVTTTVNNPTMGSVTGGGTIQSCEPITLTATPNEQYRFVNWTVGGKVVSEANPYTFIVTQNVEVTANFAPAVFKGIVWKNLFHKEEDDITKESLDGTLNNRLWRLYQVQFNKYAGNRNDKGLNTYGEFDVAGFIGTEARGNSNVKYLTAEEANETYPFAWLGKYIEDVSGTKILNITNESSRRSHLNYIMYMFFNRTNKARNSSAADATYLVQWTDNTKSFKGADGYGMPIKWRPYWTEYACKLPNTLEHDDPMPTTWTKLSCSTDPIKNDAGTIIGTPADWYQWNNPPSEKHLLAWRDGSTSGDIVHHVSRDNMELYATYVDRHISEVKDNTDVIRLMQNSGYKNNPHALTVERKLQAGMYNTICFPFTVYIDDQTDNGVPHSGLAADHPLKGATVLNLIGKNELYNESGDPVVVLNFEQVNKLEAGKPYLIKLAENQPSITEPIPFTGIAYDDLTYTNGNQTITIDDATISFHAMISPGNIPAEAVILVADNRLATITASGPLNGLRGYFTIDDAYLNSVAKAGRLYLSVKKPVTTSIPVAPEAEQQTHPEVRKVMKNGMIYILRDGKAYDMMGRQL